MKKIRCAIYTRKSSEEGLEQEFNSLDAQREACAAYIASQKHEGWVLLKDPYDDGGLSGGTLERPALQKLLEDIKAGRVDQIIVYKIDRLTRSLSDFAKIVDILDAADASFVSVTQSFNTAISMGRLTLNMLLSFAQFEREVTAERIRGKIAASKKKGLWMGGSVPLGYDPDGRTLLINEEEAKTVRMLFSLYERHRVIRKVKDEADRAGVLTKHRLKADGSSSGGLPFNWGHIHQILTNPIYAGRIRHKGQVYEGLHQAIIEPERWEAIQECLQSGASRSRNAEPRKTRKTKPSLLVGKLFDETGDRPTPSHSRSKTGARLRYYISHRLIAKSGETKTDGWRLPAPELEQTVAKLVRNYFERDGVISEIVQKTSANEVQALKARVDAFTSSRKNDPCLHLVARIDLAPGDIRISLDAETIARLLEINPNRITEDLPSIHSPFQIRKRGVETKIILNGAARTVDEVLLNNIALAHGWYGMLKAGKTFAEISCETGISKRRIQQMLDLAFLAPDIVRDVVRGSQPLGFTSDWVLRHELPSDWQAQRDLIATL